MGRGYATGPIYQVTHKQRKSPRSETSKNKTNEQNIDNNHKNEDKKDNLSQYNRAKVIESSEIVPENFLFLELLGKEVIVIMSTDQLNILGQTFRPIFSGTIADVTNGFITLNPVIIKMSNAPFYKFPTPLSFPMENIAQFFPFDSNRRFPLT